MAVTYPILQPFLEYIKFEKRFSRHTLISYETDLKAFWDFLIASYGPVELSQITHSIIRSWLADLKDQGMTAKTINRKISSLRSFFKYNMKTGVIRQTPMTKVVAPKSEKRLPQFVADKDIATLFDHVEFGDDWQGKTDRLVLLLFYNTGMRLSEMIQLKRRLFRFIPIRSRSWVKETKKGYCQSVHTLPKRYSNTCRKKNSSIFPATKKYWSPKKAKL
jgi:integrase/recombinase XerC